MDIYIINEVASEGFWYGNESLPFVSDDMDKVISEAYEKYQSDFESDDREFDDEILSPEEFAEEMKKGFNEGFKNGGYAVIQFYDSHIQFEPYKITI